MIKLETHETHETHETMSSKIHFITVRVWLLWSRWSSQSMDSMDSMESIDLSTRDPTDHPGTLHTTMDGQYKNHLIQKKRDQKKSQDHAEQKEDNAMHPENDKFKICKNAKNATEHQILRKIFRAATHEIISQLDAENQKHTKSLGIPISDPITSHHPLTSCGRQDQRPAPSSNPTKHGDS